MKSLILSLVLFTTLSAMAQQRKITTLNIKSDILSCALDRAGDFYLILSNGELQKYSIEGSLITSKKFGSPLTLFDPTITIRLLAYQRENQTYEWLSPNLETISAEQVDPSFAVEPQLICPSGDKDLWIFDAADFTMKRVRPSALTIQNEFRLQGAKEFTPSYIREYQNFLFALDKNGITVYNSTGRRIRQIEQKDIVGFNFLGEELYYLANDILQLVDLFTGEKRELTIPAKCNQVLITEDRIACISQNKVDIFTFSLR